MSLSIRDFFQIDGALLLQGETGTGKTYWAKKIHEHSKRSHEEFITANLAILNEDLLESELFGHVRGAFTSAFSDKVGLVQKVGEGTLFLDEVGELSLRAQKKLLMLLESGEYSPVGSSVVKKFKGRIIAATNKNLEEMVEERSFRLDLLKRLEVFSFQLPPLKGKQALIRQHLDQFMDVYSKKNNKGVMKLDKDCLDFLLNYSWPGNIREVKNCMEYMVSLSKGSALGFELIPPWILRKGKIKTSREFPLCYASAKEMFEKQYFLFVLDKFRGKINETASEIHISKATLIAKARKYDINTAILRATRSP